MACICGRRFSKLRRIGGSSRGDSAPVILYPKDESNEQERPMAEHEHGKMDIREQEKTFAGFIRYSVWVTVASIAVLIFLALANS